MKDDITARIPMAVPAQTALASPTLEAPRSAGNRPVLWLVIGTSAAVLLVVGIALAVLVLSGDESDERTDTAGPAEPTEADEVVAGPSTSDEPSESEAIRQAEPGAVPVTVPPAPPPPTPRATPTSRPATTPSPSPSAVGPWSDACDNAARDLSLPSSNAVGLEGHWVTESFDIYICDTSNGSYLYHGVRRRDGAALSLAAESAGVGYRAWNGDLEYWIGDRLEVFDGREFLVDEPATKVAP